MTPLTSAAVISALIEAVDRLENQAGVVVVPAAGVVAPGVVPVFAIGAADEFADEPATALVGPTLENRAFPNGAGAAAKLLSDVNAFAGSRALPAPSCQSWVC